jgi:hypothetical protein
MKTNYFFKSILLILAMSFSISSCVDDEALIEELDVNREFAPVGLEVFIRNQTTVELNWTKSELVNNYLIEYSENEDFSSIALAVNITADQLPFQQILDSETLYYIRVKAISSRGLQDSKYAMITAATLTEQIFLPIQPGDVLATEATLRWIPNSAVTQILLSPDDIVRDITPEEKIAGLAVISGLIGETFYTAQLLNNTSVRGVLSFTTGIDIGTGILVTPSDDLFQMIADANSGDILVLEGGDYTAQTGNITINKSLTIRGLQSFNKPVLKVNFSIVAGATEVNLIDLDLTGDTPAQLLDFIRYTEAGNYNALNVIGCNIHDYDRSFIAGNVTDAIINTVIVDNCIVTNVLTNGGDFIDFRNSDALNVEVTNSTFNNCAPGRDFFRIDAAGTSNNSGLTVNVLLDSCTLYGVSNTEDRILYIRFLSNAITVRNNLFAATTAYYSNQSSTSPATTFLNNNYFNAPGFSDSTKTLYDATDTFTTLDPGFANAAGGDFTISNQSLIDNNVGDPRWRQ